MRILLINSPSRKCTLSFTLPFGLLYVGSIIERCGHEAKIFDPYLYDVGLRNFDSGNFENIYKVIEYYKPSIIGFGGIASSYGRTKRLSWALKNRYPDIFQIAGGTLSSLSELLLTRTKIDMAFHGEVENSLPIFLQRFQDNKSLYDTPGISYLSENKKIISTVLPKQVYDIDSIPLPAYHLIEIKRYVDSVKLWIEANQQLFNAAKQMRSIINKIGDRTHYISIVTARGCTHGCSFCYRHMRGMRQHSPKYIIDHIRYLMENYGIEGFAFTDELFNSNPAWVLELCDLIKKEKLNIFYLVGGARVDRMNEEILYRLKETGCIEINYGQESGSDIILKEYRKGVTVQQNREITILTHKIGITCPVQIVIGSPGETNATVRETIKFLKEVDAFRLAWNYLIPLPKAPIWKYVEEHRLINDVEKYLDDVAEYGGSPLVNLTKVPDKVWKNWSLLIRKEMVLHYYRKVNLKQYYFYKFLYILTDSILPIIPQKVRKFIPLWAKSWYWIPKAKQEMVFEGILTK